MGASLCLQALSRRSRGGRDKGQGRGRGLAVAALSPAQQQRLRRRPKGSPWRAALYAVAVSSGAEGLAVWDCWIAFVTGFSIRSVRDSPGGADWPSPERGALAASGGPPCAPCRRRRDVDPGATPSLAPSYAIHVRCAISPSPCAGLQRPPCTPSRCADVPTPWPEKRPLFGFIWCPWPVAAAPRRPLHSTLGPMQNCSSPGRPLNICSLARQSASCKVRRSRLPTLHRGADWPPVWKRDADTRQHTLLSV